MLRIPDRPCQAWARRARTTRHPIMCSSCHSPDVTDRHCQMAMADAGCCQPGIEVQSSACSSMAEICGVAEASQKRSFAVEDLCGKADIFIDHSWVLLCKGVSVETIAKRWRIWAALLCAVTIALTGCGKKSESSASASTNAGDHWAAGITADSAGNLYVADGHAHIIRKISPSGEITTVAGADGIGSG